jgi:A/G-specific adenine glycosylase
MDLGSAVCVTRRPRCLICPLVTLCRSAGRVETGRRIPAAPGEAFERSSRFYRGRLLAVLTALPAGTVAPLDQVRDRLATSGVAEPGPGWTAIAEALARDGLARVEAGGSGVTVGLA